jgi:hypothetical protein
MPQVKDHVVEVIVPYDATVGDVVRLADEFPGATFIDMGTVPTDAPAGSHLANHELYDRRRARGLGLASGDILALLEDSGAPGPGWCQEVLKAHWLPYDVIGGAVEHEGKGALNWAVYFQDFGRYQLPLREGPARYLTDINVSYKRPALECVRELWTQRYHEVTVNWALVRAGCVLWQRPQMTVYQDRGQLTLSGLMEERFSWGRLFGNLRVQETPLLMRFLYIALSPGIPLVRLARMATKIFRDRRNRGWFLRSLLHNLVLTLSWSLGEVIGYLTDGKPGG